MYEALFEPLKLGSNVAKNRLVRASTTTNLAEQQSVGDRLLAHYERLARGGVGTIVSEALRMHPTTVHRPSDIGAFLDKNVPGFATWAERMHANDVLIIGQLGHSGRQHTSSMIPGRLVGPSPVACPRSGGVPHPLSIDEIEDLIAGFVTSAKNLAAGGLDGVEINAAQGHLLQQFLSPFSNKRTDQYGGCEEDRWRFLLTVLDLIRDAVGPDFIIGLRLGIEEFTEGGLTVELTNRFVERVVGQGAIDYLSLSQGNFNSIDAHLPDRHLGRTPYAAQQGEVGQTAGGLPVLACTQILTPDDAVDILDRGWADGVALGRALTVDPDWPNKARDGSADRIRTCIQCNHCWAGLHEGDSTLTCVQNAEVGNERAIAESRPTDRPRRVVVIGGGPGGLETARVAASRRHHVTLFERAPRLGGKVESGAELGGHLEYRNAARWLIGEVERLEVDLRVGEAASIDNVSDCGPDAVVIATGARPVDPGLSTDDSVHVPLDLSELPQDLNGEGVVVFDEDGHYWAAQVTEELALRGASVSLVTRFFEPFREMPIVSRIAALRMLDEYGVEHLPVHEPCRIQDGSVHLRHYLSKRPHMIADVAAAHWVGPQQPNNELVSELQAVVHNDSLFTIGDAFAPRRLQHAMKEGNVTGRSL